MSLDQQVNSVKEMLYREMEHSRNIVFSGMFNTDNINKIPESLFVRYFLPCFLGNGVNTNWVMEWISISGSPVAEVGITDDNTKELLFIVPSILNTNNLFLTKSEGDIGDIFGRYDQINSNMPTSGLSFLVQALQSKNAELISRINFNEINSRWVNILQRYNIVNNINQAAPQSNSSSLDDLFEM